MNSVYNRTHSVHTTYASFAIVSYFYSPFLNILALHEDNKDFMFPDASLTDIIHLPSLLRAEDNTCGCWGENQIYVHYKPPVSGWFILSRQHKFVYERVYTVPCTSPQTHHFLLRYMVKRKYWILLEKKAGRWVSFVKTLLSVS